MPVVPPTQSVWAINETTTGVVTVSKGLLEVASSDNIDTLALLSAAEFGSVLPVSPETRLKIEALANRNHTSHAMTFIKATIGYRKDDSVRELAKSDGGIRFLCFVATLYTMGISSAALRLDRLLRATQKEAVHRPTIRHLQDLLNVLQTKLKISDFAGQVASWEGLFRTIISGLSEERELFSFSVAIVPPEKGFEKFILAMNESSRIGEESDLVLKVLASNVPWLLAFIKWSLGQVPRVLLPSGKSILDVAVSAVTLQLVPNPAAPRQGMKRRHHQIDSDKEAQFEVMLYRKVGKLRDLMFTDDQVGRGNAWKGLLNIREWMSYRLNTIFEKFPQISSGSVLRLAVGQCLYFIVGELPDKLILSEDALYSHIAERVRPGMMRPFPPKQHRIALAETLLEERIELQYVSRDDAEILRPDNLRQYIQACDRCKELSLSRPVGSRPELKKFGGTLPCQVHDFLDEIGGLGADLLTLSLFGRAADLESFPMLRGGNLYDPNSMHRPLYHHFFKRSILKRDSFPLLVQMGWQSIMHGRCNFLTCSSEAVFQHAKALLDHPKTDVTLISSSAAGQVIYPLFFDAQMFVEEGYLQMSTAQGQLIYENMVFSCVEDANATDAAQDLPDNESTSTAMEVVNDIEVSDDEEAKEDNRALSQGSHEMESDPINVEEDISTTADAHNDDGDNSPPRESQHQANPSEYQSRQSQAAATQLKHELGVNYVPENLTPSNSSSIPWTVSVNTTRLLARANIPGESRNFFAWNLMDALSRVVLVNGCTHKLSRKAGPLGLTFLLSTDLTELLDSEGPKHVIDAGRKLLYQQAAVASQDEGLPVVVNNGACIRCALELCERLQLKIVVT